MANIGTTFLEAYAQIWPLCVVFIIFFTAIALSVRHGRDTTPVAELNTRVTFWACTLSGTAILAACLTLIDKPLLGNSEEAKEWLFMFAAFLGIPIAMPLYAGAAWAAAHHLLGHPLKAAPFGILLLGTFALSTAASNLHDVLWCATYTDAYTHHAPAGYDLDLFVAAGRPFGIPEATMADYATLGPFALLLVLGELLVAWACFTRLIPAKNFHAPASTAIIKS